MVKSGTAKSKLPSGDKPVSSGSKTGKDNPSSASKDQESTLSTASSKGKEKDPSAAAKKVNGHRENTHAVESETTSNKHAGEGMEVDAVQRDNDGKEDQGIEDTPAVATQSAAPRSRKRNVDAPKSNSQSKKPEKEEIPVKPETLHEKDVEENIPAPSTSSAPPKSRKRKAEPADSNNQPKKPVTEEVTKPLAKSGALLEKGDIPAPATSSAVPKSRKRKVESPVSNSQSKKAEREEAVPLTEPKNEEETSAATTSSAVATSSAATKSNKRTVKAPASKSKTIKSIKEESTKASTTKYKTSHEKILLPIPSLRSISGKVFVIGENDVGQLGLGPDVEYKARPALLELPHTIADIASGGMHSVCLTQSGEVMTFGCNDEGALGRITSDETDEGAPLKVDLPEKVVQISAGDSHSAALSESGQVYLWGNFRNGEGQMGLTADGSKQIKPIKVLSNVEVVKIASGAEHLVCLSREGVVYTCGCGQSGQLGRLSQYVFQDGGRKGLSTLVEPAQVHIPLSNAKKSVPIDDIWTGSYATYLKAKDTKEIYAFGLNNYSQLGYAEEGTFRLFPKQIESFDGNDWSQISGGQHHTLALSCSGVVYSFGRHDYGRLGLGEDSNETPVPTVIPTLETEKCVNVSSGNCVSFAVTENGRVFSWGFGENHQLGHGNDKDRVVPSLISGDFLQSWRAFKVSGGGQHTLLLARPIGNAEN